MNLEAGRLRRSIEVRQDGQGWLVIADGRRLSATLVRSGAQWSLLVGPAGGGRYRTHELAFGPFGRASVRVRVDGREVPVSWDVPAGARPVAPPSRNLQRSVRSPMAGRVTRLLVEPGQAVAANQGLLVVEAMKMENELRAPVAGVVLEVMVVAGEPVEAGALLVVLE